MYDEKLKDWIRENILDKNGNPQGRSFTVRQKKNVRECDIILELTSFLENDCSIAERIYYVMNDLDRKVLCFNKGCDKFVSFNGYKYGYSTYCSSICAVNDDTIKEKMRNTNLERYGVKYASQLETFKDKSKKTCLKKYGVENPFESEIVKNKIKKKNMENLGVEYPMQSKSIREKSKQTLLKKYGVDHSSKIPEVIEKRKQTSLKNYGVENPNQSQIIKKKIRETNIKNHGVEHILSLPRIRQQMKESNMKRFGVPHNSQKHLSMEIINKLNNKEWIIEQYFTLEKSFSQIASEIGVTKKTIINHFHEFELEATYTKVSREENQIKSYIQNIGYRTKDNVRFLVENQEIDVLVPDKDIAIEYDGIYWHSDYLSSKSEWNSIKIKDYHLNKTEQCKEKNVQLFHVFENEWMNEKKQEIWKSIISNKLGQNKTIQSDKCVIVEIIDEIIIRDFLRNNHLRGDYTKGINIGLYHKEELISLIVIDNNEIVRYCNKIFIGVCGGLKILTDYYIDKYNPDKVIMKLNRRYHNEDICKETKLSFQEYTEPNCFYFDLKEKYPIFYSEENKQDILRNVDINRLTQYRRIFDCGDIIYAYQL